MITPNKEFFQWIYNRLVYVHNENPNVDYMISFKERIRELSFDEHHWKPSEEQMEVLLSTQDMVRSSGYRQNAKVLASLYERLQKL